MLNRYTYFRTKGSGGFRSIFSDEPQPTLYFLDALLHNPHDTSTPQDIIPTIHHPHHTSPPRYIIPTIHHPHHTSSSPYITSTIHHRHNTSSSPYIIPTIHHPHHTSPPPYIISTIHHPTIHHLHHTYSHHTYSSSYMIPIIHHPRHTSPLPYIVPVWSCIIPNHTLSFSTVPANVHNEAWSGISREHPQWESDVWDMFCDILHQNRSMSPQDEDMLLTDSN